MESKQVRCLTDQLGHYDYLAKDHSYISLSEWPNGEGYEVDINGEQHLSLTKGMIDALFYLKNKFEYEK